MSVSDKAYKVTALGEALIDFTESVVSSAGMRLFEQNPGGAPANLICAVSRLGMKTAFIGKVGRDMHGKFLIKTLNDAGVDIRGMMKADDAFTTMAFVSLTNGEREFSFARKPGADSFLNISDLSFDILDNTAILHVGSLSLSDEPARTATYGALHRAKEAGAVISYDPNYREAIWRSRNEAILRMREPLALVDIMKLSEEEIMLLTEYSDSEKAAIALNEKGVSLVAVTLGKVGALVCKDGKCIVVPGYDIAATDTTGAGDAFWGGFLYKLIQSEKCPKEINLEEAATFAQFGNATATLCVSRRGGIPAMPTLTEVIQLMSEGRIVQLDPKRLVPG